MIGNHNWRGVPFYGNGYNNYCSSVGSIEENLNKALEDFDNYLLNKNNFENNLLKLADKFVSKGLSFIDFQNYLIRYGIMLNHGIINRDTYNKLESVFKNDLILPEPEKVLKLT